MIESGYPGMSLTFWAGLWAPAGTPDAAVRNLNAEINAVVFDDGIGGALADAFEADLADSVEIQRDAWHDRGTLARLTDRAAAILTPLL